jgi:deferrochelatase/peroxidase EfeB
MRAPTIYDTHQPGIATPHLQHGAFAAFDIESPEVIAKWTVEAEALMREGAMTVTIGLGASLFDERFGLAEQRPAGLRDLPAFAGDQLDPSRCGGDACVLICADEPVDALRRFGIPRWQQRGTRTDQGALGFRDGTLNLRRPRDFDRHVWVSGRERSWMVGGTFLVVRDIDVLDSWERLAEHDQEQIIGRHRGSGAPLGRSRLYDAPILEDLPPDSHIRLAAPRSNEGAALLRRGYDTQNGLLFLAFQKDPRRQYVPVQRRLAEHDALHPHTRHVGSALFAIPPGARRPHGLAHALLYAQ